MHTGGSPGGATLLVKNPPANAGDIRNAGSFELGRSPGGGHTTHSNISCLQNPIDRGAWWSTVNGVAKSQTGLKQLSTAQHGAYWDAFLRLT